MKIHVLHLIMLNSEPEQKCICCLTGTAKKSRVLKDLANMPSNYIYVFTRRTPCIEV